MVILELVANGMTFFEWELDLALLQKQWVLCRAETPSLGVIKVTNIKYKHVPIFCMASRVMLPYGSAGFG
jgi:hypothetical protein